MKSMRKRFHIRPYGPTWDICDGDEVIVEGIPTRSEARQRLLKMLEESATLKEAEMRYASQYAYACGYHD